MLRAWWKSIYAITGVMVLLSIGLLYGGSAAFGVADEHLIYVVVVGVWWLKPAYDRFVLAVLSSAVFGTVPNVISLLREARGVLRRGLLWQLTLGRIDLARSFHLPVWQLERRPRTARRARFRVLDAQTRGYATGITVVFLHIETVLYISTFGLIYLLLPAASVNISIELGEDDAWSWLRPEGFVAAAVYAGIVAFVEPIYVACGFGLYLNRRTILEAWDIEIDFRRLAKRLSESEPGSRTGLASLVLTGALILLGTPLDGYAAREPLAESPVHVSAGETAKQVLAEPPFLVRDAETAWSLRDDWGKLEWPEWLNWEWGGRFGFDAEASAHAWQQVVHWLARGLEALLWITVAAGAAWLGIRATRWSREQRGFSNFRFDVGQDSVEIASGVVPSNFPDNPADVAQTSAAAGDHRAALALLYQASLSKMEALGVWLPKGATEDDVLRAMGGEVRDELAGFMRRLVPAWLGSAYARQRPSASSVVQLCQDWRQLFAPPTDRSTPDAAGESTGESTGKSTGKSNNR